MPVLSRKLAVEVLNSFVINLFLLTLLSTLMLTNKLSSNLSMAALLELLPWLTICGLKFSVPVAMIISCTQLSAQWKSDREYLAAASGGLSLYVFLRPVLLMSLALSACYVLACHDLIPRAWQEVRTGLSQQMQQVYMTQARRGIPMVLSHEERLFIGSVQHDTLRDITYTKVQYQRDEQDKLLIISADIGKIIGSEDGVFRLECQNVMIDKISEGKQESEKVNSYTFLMDAKNKKASSLGGPFAGVISSKLPKSNQGQSELTMRWVNASSLPFLALIGFYLGLIIPWKNRAASFIAALLPAGLAYFFPLDLIDNQIESTGLNHSALWGVLVGLCLLGLLFKRVSRKTGFI